MGFLLETTLQHGNKLEWHEAAESTRQLATKQPWQHDTKPPVHIGIKMQKSSPQQVSSPSGLQDDSQPSHQAYKQIRLQKTPILVCLFEKGGFMRVIALISQKGGVGKTTLAIHLATAFATAGYNTLLLDLDPQASSAEWKDSRAAETPPVMAIPPARLAKVIEHSKSIGTDVMILDTAPHSEGTALDASRAADLIIVPCQPSIMDLRALRKTASLLEHAKKPTYAILNGVSPHTSVADDAAKAIADQFKLEVSPIRMGDRVAYNRCLISGQTAQEFEPEGKAAQEVQEFFRWTSKLVGLPTRKREAA